MIRQNLGRYIADVIDWANRPRDGRPGSRASLAHLFLACLDDHALKRTTAFEGAVAAITAKVLPAIPILPHGPHSADRVWFDIDAANRDLNEFFRVHPPGATASESLLDWLLGGKLVDPTNEPCRQICRDFGVRPTDDDLPGPPAGLSFGVLADAKWARTQGRESCLARDDDLKKHLRWLEVGVGGGRPYLLEGLSEVGKSTFLRELIRRAGERFDRLSVAALREMTFVLFEPSDFLGPADRAEERFSQLAAFLAAHPASIAVIDGLDVLLNPAHPTAEAFAAHLIGRLHGGGLVLVARAGTATAREVLRHLTPRILPPLPADAVAEFLPAWVKRRLAVAGLPADGTLDGFAREVVTTAVERYAARQLPGVALDLARCAVDRAADDNPAGLPPARVEPALRDALWDHIVDELNLSPELAGRDPAAFYRGLESRLLDRVFGQEHAVRRVCETLASLAGRRRQLPTPRGRYLFVGPPGVGKTQLARALAEELGYAADAFFIFNMAEYSSDTARTRFLGADPGYVGFRSTRTVFDAVRHRSSCVVLLDEVDRAHRSIHDVLLGILEGRGADSEGQPVDFRQVIFVLTSNRGQEAIVSANEDGVAAGETREATVGRLDDRTLRGILLGGVESGTEERMLDHARREVRALAAEIEARLTDPTAPPDPEVGLAIDDYLTARAREDRLRSVRHESPIDGAFLDRIDHLIPFLPIDRREDTLSKVLTSVLIKLDWPGCPQRDVILARAEDERVSARGLERLVREYLPHRLLTDGA